MSYLGIYQACCAWSPQPPSGPSQPQPRHSHIVPITQYGAFSWINWPTFKYIRQKQALLLLKHKNILKRKLRFSTPLPPPSPVQYVLKASIIAAPRWIEVQVIYSFHTPNYFMPVISCTCSSSSSTDCGRLGLSQKSEHWMQIHIEAPWWSFQYTSISQMPLFL